MRIVWNGEGSQRVHGLRGRFRDDNSLHGLGDADITDTIPMDDGGETVYYADGGWIQYDANGNAVDTSYSGGGADPLSTPTGGFNMDYFGTTTIPATVASIPDAAVRVANNGGKSIRLPVGTTEQMIQQTIQRLATQAVQTAGQVAGNWVARNVGGSTVLYRQSAGGVGTMNLQSLLIPGILLLAVMKGK